MRMMAVILSLLALAGCDEARERRWSIAVRPAETGAYYGTFQSHLPTFAATSAALYRSRTLDVGAGRSGQARAGAVELRIDRREGGDWRTVFRRSGHFNPACLVADGQTVYAAISDQRSGDFSVVAFDEREVREYARPAPLATASKVNCAIYDGALLFMTTYGAVAIFDLAERRFRPEREAFRREYEAGACTHYPHISVARERIFVGHNSVLCADANAGYLDMIGYFADAEREINPRAAWMHLLPEYMRGRDIWIADTWLADDRLYFAGAISTCPADAPVDLAATENASCSAAFFGECEAALQCQIRRTNVGQGMSGNFVSIGRDLYFFGDGFRRINVWRLRNGDFALEAAIAHGVRCPYAFNFSPHFQGVVEGQVTDMGRCGDGVDRYVSFSLRPS